MKQMLEKHEKSCTEKIKIVQEQMDSQITEIKKDVGKDLEEELEANLSVTSITSLHFVCGSALLDALIIARTIVFYVPNGFVVDTTSLAE